MVGNDTAARATIATDAAPTCNATYLPEVPEYAYVGCVEKPWHDRHSVPKAGAWHNLATELPFVNELLVSFFKGPEKGDQCDPGPRLSKRTHARTRACW